MKKYLVTGGLGSIGVNLVNLISKKNKIYIVDDKSNKISHKLNLNKNIKIIKKKSKI